MPKRIFIATSILLPLMTAACGSSSAGDPASAAMFVGNWSPQEGSAETNTCGTQSDTVALIDSVTISLTAPNSGEIETLPANGCALKWVANGNIATLAGTQACTVSIIGGVMWQPTFTSGTLTLGSGTIDLQDKGTAVESNDGANQNCMFTQSGSYKNG